MIVFVQCFPMANGGGGGARILRRLTEGMDETIRFVCTSPTQPEELLKNEIWIPIRPSMGRLDRSRFRRVVDILELPYRSLFQRRIKKFLQDVKAREVHVIPHHNSDFFAVAEIVSSMGIPIVCSIHDDFRYVNSNHFRKDSFEKELSLLWNMADARFCIGREIGGEYCRRYGNKEFSIVTDGVDIADIKEPEKIEGSISPYFMGLFHNGYRENLSSFLDGLQLLRSGCDIRIDPMRLRCGSLTGFDYCRSDDFEILPFASQATVATDIKASSLLYLPLPFGSAYDGFVKFSFSTKLISYLCSGKLIVYHGPRASALANYLEETKCAIMLYTSDSSSIARKIAVILEDESSILELTRNAMQAAMSDFDINQIRERFWNKFSKNEH